MAGNDKNDTSSSSSNFLISFLNGTQVRRNNEYINGFRDNPYSDKWTMYIKENYGK